MRQLTNADIDKSIKSRKIIRIEDFITVHTHINWKCLICNHQWSAIPSNIIYLNSNCPSCHQSKIKTTNNKVQQELSKRNIINLQSLDEINVNTKITWKCLICNHQWQNTPNNILNKKKQGCRNCYIQSLKTPILERLENRNIEMLQNPKTYLQVVRWKCKKCKTIWKTNANNILNNNSGCPSCAIRSYSSKAIRWLNSIIETQQINISHAENGGEVKLKNMVFKVDGFCKDTNTVYEFYGDYWHGNPKKYKRSGMHPQLNTTFGQLYEKTLNRETQIINAGYNLITKWESEFNENTKTKKKSKLS